MMMLSARSVTRALQRRALASSASSSVILESPLNQVHVDHHGKLVPFAGWSLPVQYQGLGVMTESLHTRCKASIFDVSHMQQLKLHGDSDARIAFLERVCVASISLLKPDQGQYSLLTNNDGGIIDDFVVINRGSYSHIVCNAACSAKDIAHFTEQIGLFNESSKKSVELEIISDQALVAVQGPYAAELVSKLLEEADRERLKSLGFFYSADMTIAGVPCFLSRTGYTGEDGFEISIPIPSSIAVVEELLSDKDCQLAGLGARDALRLEAGMCLYGHDLDDTTTPIEAGLTWTIGKRRRAEGGFLGAERILAQLSGEHPIKRTRVGLLVEGAPAREGADVLDSLGAFLGRVTSGGFSPVLQRPIAMAYVSTNVSVEPGTKLGIVVRNKTSTAIVAKLPFVPTKYVKKVATKKVST